MYFGEAKLAKHTVPVNHSIADAHVKCLVEKIQPAVFPNDYVRNAQSSHYLNPAVNKPTNKAPPTL